MQPDEQDMNSEMLPVLWVSRLLGTAPCNFVPIPNGYRVSISRRWAIYGYVITALHGLVNTVILVLKIWAECGSEFNYSVKVPTMLGLFQLMLSYYTVGMATFTAPRRMKHFTMYIKSMQEINKNITCDRTSGEKKIWFAWSIILYALFGTAMLLLTHLVFLVHSKLRKKLVFMWLFYSAAAVYVLVTILKYQIVFILFSILTTLRAINHDLSKLLRKSKQTSRDFYTVIHKYSHLYDALRGVILQINELEGGLFFVLFVQNFFYLAVTTYDLGVAAKEGSMRATLMECAWLSFYLSHIVIITEACHRAKTEMDKMKCILCKVASVIPANKQLMKETENFLEQLSLDHGVFSPLGVFSLTRSSIVTTLSIITTFVITLIQFNLLDDENTIKIY